MPIPLIERRPGTYLLHFCQPLGDPDRPVAYAQHYCGSAKSIAQRIEQHRRSVGHGAIVHAANARGIIWIVARIVYQDSVQDAVELERRWKRASHLRRRCPICQEADLNAKTVTSPV